MATSGFNSRVLSTASLPSATSAATSQPDSPSRRARKPLRTISWSSASNKRTPIISPYEVRLVAATKHFATTHSGNRNSEGAAGLRVEQERINANRNFAARDANDYAPGLGGK